MINNTDLNLEDETTKISIEKEEREKEEEEDTSNFETKASDKINDTFSYYETRSIADLR